MKLFLRRSLILFMAFVVLAASTGFGVIEHHCLMRGKSLHLAALQKEGTQNCQPKSAKAPLSDKATFQKQDCCDDQQSYENVDVSSSVTQWVAKFLQIVSDAFIGALVAVFKSIIGLFATSTDAALSVFSFTSLFHGRSLLSFVQSFLI